MVAQLADGERAGAEAVLVRRTFAGNDGPLEVGVAFDLDIEAAFSSLDAGLFDHTGVVAADLLLAEVDAATGAAPHRHAAADTLIFAGVGTGVLPAFQIEIAANIGRYLLATDHRTSQVGVIARLQRKLITGGDMGVFLGDILAIHFATAQAAIGGDAKRSSTLAVARRNTRAPAGSATLGFAVGRILGRNKVDVAIRRERGIVARRKVAANDVEVGLFACPCRADRQVIPSLDQAAAVACPV